MQIKEKKRHKKRRLKEELKEKKILHESVSVVLKVLDSLWEELWYDFKIRKPPEEDEDKHGFHSRCIIVGVCNIGVTTEKKRV